MKTEEKYKTKSTIEQLREIRDKISLEIKDLNFEQLKKYLEEKKTLHSVKLWSREKSGQRGSAM